MKKTCFAVVCATVLLLAGCGEKAAEKSDAKTKSGAAPVLALSSAEGKAGETVDVTFSVSGADKKWSASGVHILYDENLVCVPSESDPEAPKMTLGAAVDEMTACIALIWTEDKIQELIDKKMDSVFFCSAASGDLGKDGDIATFSFTIPQNAEAGTVYNLEFFFREGDMFVNNANDEDFQEYAFSHSKNGSITVTE